MPTLDATEYERFSFDEANRAPLSLDEAVKQAREKRSSDPANFYRVKMADEGQMTFYVAKISKASVYADFLARVTKTMGRLLLHSKTK
jgi:hypothetical protein